jgi:hypothetical protein
VITVHSASIRRTTTLGAVALSTAVIELLQRPQVVGEVVAVHRAAVNLRLGTRSVTLAREGAGGLPDGILLTDAFDPRDLELHAGLLASADATSVRLADRLVIDLRGAVGWSPRPGVHTSARRDLADRSATLRAALESAGRSGFDGFPIPATTHLEGFRGAVIGGGPGALAAAGIPLIGLGAGLTPSGDDLLVGLSAAMTCLGDPRGQWLAGRWAAASAGRTTFVAESFHRHAARGEYAERLTRVVGAIIEEDGAGIDAALAFAAGFGATSGVDTLLGVAFGLEAAA